MPDKCVMNKCIFPIHSHQHRIKVSEPKLATLKSSHRPIDVGAVCIAYYRYYI